MDAFLIDAVRTPFGKHRGGLSGVRTDDLAALPIAGGVMDAMGNRFIFVWFSAFSAFGIALLYLLYVDWKKLGGDASYVAPVNRDTAKNLAQAMGAVSRMAGALADNKLDKDAAASAVEDAQKSIDAYNTEVAAQKERCS